MASVADAPTLPASLRVVESVLLTVSTVALAMSPVPWSAPTTPFFTVSTSPASFVVMTRLLSARNGVFFLVSDGLRQLSLPDDQVRLDVLDALRLARQLDGPLLLHFAAYASREE